MLRRCRLGLCGAVLAAGLIWLFTVADLADPNGDGPLPARFFLFAGQDIAPMEPGRVLVSSCRTTQKISRAFTTCRPDTALSSPVAAM